MKKYNPAEMDIIEFDTEDVITTSPCEEDTNDEDETGGDE